MTSETFDVVIVGAGLSGIGAACHLQKSCPKKSYVVLESRRDLGGTWDLFRYPGIRSDSDMHTLGYEFKPWTESKAIADGPAILEYIRETAYEHGVDQHIRYEHKVLCATWSSADAMWVLQIVSGESFETRSIRCNLLFMCAGYYDYAQGYVPEFDGYDRYKGRIVHPQFWPDNLDYKGKNIVVVGSGATAMTLIPEMAKDAGHIVMLQRSPTYVISFPDEDFIANSLRKFLPDRWAYAITRWKNINLQQWMYAQTRKRPRMVKKILLRWVRKELGKDYDVDTHFTPAYNPWDQRLCLVPNSDLFEALRSGKASIVTDTIDTFTENGILLNSGGSLQADMIVMATGLDLVVLGGVEFIVDGEVIDFADTISYKGIMTTGVPNVVSTFGYINASWTLRADLVATWFCRLVNYMDSIGARQAMPRLRPEDRDMATHPYIRGFSSGYIKRVLERSPRQGDYEPWTNPQNYKRDRRMFREGAIDDGALVFETSRPASTGTYN